VQISKKAQKYRLEYLVLIYYLLTRVNYRQQRRTWRDLTRWSDKWQLRLGELSVNIWSKVQSSEQKDTSFQSSCKGNLWAGSWSINHLHLSLSWARRLSDAPFKYQAVTRDRDSGSPKVVTAALCHQHQASWHPNNATFSLSSNICLESRLIGLTLSWSVSVRI
jgi:hypothetical protein